MFNMDDTFSIPDKKNKTVGIRVDQLTMLMIDELKGVYGPDTNTISGLFRQLVQEAYKEQSGHRSWIDLFTDASFQAKCAEKGCNIIKRRI